MSWTATIVASAMMFMVACCTAKQAEATRQSCVSSCGLLFDGTPNGAMSCDQLQEAENVTLKVMDEDHCKDDPRMCRKTACDAMFGYQIIAEDAESIIWISDGEVLGPFIGVTSPGSKTITLAKAADWRSGSIPHEMVHAMQGGVPPKSWIEGDQDKENGVGHSGWTQHGVYKSIEDIRLRGRK